MRLISDQAIFITHIIIFNLPINNYVLTHRSKVKFDSHQDVQSLIKVVFISINIICFYK